MYLSYRLPVKLIFNNLDVIWLYPMFNAALSCLGLTIIFGLKDETITRVKLATVMLCTLTVGVIVLYIGNNWEILVDFLSFLLISLPLFLYMPQTIDIKITIGGGDNSSMKLYKATPEGSTAGGGGAQNSGPSVSADGSQPSQDNTQDLVNVIENLPLEMKHLLSNPRELANFMSARLSILNNLPQFNTGFKREIVQLALDRTNSTPVIPNKVSDSAKNYWYYHAVYCKAILEENIIAIILERLESADRIVGEDAADRAYKPDTVFTPGEHTKNFKILKAIAFAEMKNSFAEQNHEQRRLIKRTLERSNCKVITNESNIDDEDLD